MTSGFRLFFFNNPATHLRNYTVNQHFAISQEAPEMSGKTEVGKEVVKSRLYLIIHLRQMSSDVFESTVFFLAHWLANTPAINDEQQNY